MSKTVVQKNWNKHHKHISPENHLGSRLGLPDVKHAAEVKLTDEEAGQQRYFTTNEQTSADAVGEDVIDDLDFLESSVIIDNSETPGIFNDSVNSFNAKPLTESPTESVVLNSDSYHRKYVENAQTTSRYCSPAKKKKSGHGFGVGSLNEWSSVRATYTPEPCPFEPYGEKSEIATPSDSEDFDAVREAVQILKSSDRTVVFAIVVDKNNEKNVVSAIRCAGGTAFGGYARDSARDSYIVQCVHFAQIGQVPFSLAMTMPNIGVWQVKIPIPESILEKHFTPHERKILDGLREKYPKEGYDIHFMQMLGCN